MSTLLIRLQGPMQSWGTSSRFDERETQLEPSKSGVLGMVCAALGRDRREPVDDLAALRMGVRVDREGVPMRDYQTATGVMLAKGEIDHKRAVVSPRHYLSDAAFLVGLEGTDRNLLEQIHRALQFPVWPLSLGRKSFVPGLPPHLPDGVRQEELIDALSNYPRLASPQHTQPSAVRLMLEDRNKGSIRFDQPVAPFAERRFGLRYVELRRIYVPD